MSLKDNDSRAVASIRFNDSDNYAPHAGQSFTFEWDYAGDRDEFWIVHRDAAGKELARHNARHCSSIFFKP